MANISSVEDTLVNLVSEILYPNGSSQPSVVPSVDNIFVYAGWPRPADIEKDMRENNSAHITIFPQNTGRNTTRFPQVWHEKEINVPTLTATVLNNTITIGGTVSVPQAVMAVINKEGYGYGVQAGDTLNTIASNLSALIPNATALNNIITINDAHSIIARVTQSGKAIKEIKRQEVVFNVITWANSRDKRTDVSDPIEKGLGALSRFLLSDSFYAPIFYMGLKDHDEFQKTYSIYRRDLMFRVEYPTTVEMDASTITDTSETITFVDHV